MGDDARAALTHAVLALARGIAATQELAQLRRLLRAARHLVDGTQDPDDGCLNVLRGHSAAGRWHAVFVDARSGHYATVAEVMLRVVAPDWLSCLSSGERDELFFAFFERGPPRLVLGMLLEKLRTKASEGASSSAGVIVELEADADVESPLQASRHRIMRETAYLTVGRVFAGAPGVARLIRGLGDDAGSEHHLPTTIRETARLLVSVPDWIPDARDVEAWVGPADFVCATLTQLLDAVVSEEAPGNAEPSRESDTAHRFAASLVERYCRRGHTTLVAKVLSGSVRSKLPPGKSRLGPQIWHGIASHLRDVHALRTLLEGVLLWDAAWDRAGGGVGEGSAFATCFGLSLRDNDALGAALMDEVVLKKALPLESIRHLLNAVAYRKGGSAGTGKVTAPSSSLSLGAVVFRVCCVWGNEECLALYPAPLQASLSCLLIEGLRLCARPDVENEHTSVPHVLSGVSLRLGNPSGEIRSQGMAVGRALSIVLDPAHPLGFGDGIDHAQAVRAALEEATRGAVPEVGTDEAADATDRGGEGQGDVGATAALAFKAVHGYGTNHTLDGWTDDLSSASEASDSDDASVSSLEPYDMSDEEDEEEGRPQTMAGFLAALRKPDCPGPFEYALKASESMVAHADGSLRVYAPELAKVLLYANVPDEFMTKERAGRTPAQCRRAALVALLVRAPMPSAGVLIDAFYSVHLGVSHRLGILDAMGHAAARLSGNADAPASWDAPPAISRGGGRGQGQGGPQPSDRRRAVGEVRVFAPVSLRRKEAGLERTERNRFAPVAHAFMLPLLGNFDARGEGVDLVGRDHVLLGRLMQTAALFLRCLGAAPQAHDLAVLYFEFIDQARMLRHPDSFVRRSALHSVRQIFDTLPGYVLLAAGGAGFSMSRVEEVACYLSDSSSQDPDEDCRMLASAALHRLQAMSAAPLGLAG